MPTRQENVLDRLIRSGAWTAARRALKSELKRDPGNHWLLARLSLTYYEQRKYRRACDVSRQALARAPLCPLALWDHAGALQMLGRHREALRLYTTLVRRGVDSIAHGECGEGVAKARGLVADCCYRQSLSYSALGQRRRALAALAEHLEMRGPGCRSIYPLTEVGKRREQISNTRTTV